MGSSSSVPSNGDIRSKSEAESSVPKLPAVSTGEQRTERVNTGKKDQLDAPEERLRLPSIAVAQPEVSEKSIKVDSRGPEFESKLIQVRNEMPAEKEQSEKSLKTSNVSLKSSKPKDEDVEQTQIKDDEVNVKRMAAMQDSQDLFTASLRLSCDLAKPENVLKATSSDIWMLELRRAPSRYLSLSAVLQRVPFLQVLDVSGNQLGPVGFRSLMYAMCHNTTIVVLNVADNQTDTDSAVSVGKMLSENQTLSCLDVSGNYLGKECFSRCVGSALSKNNTLTILRCRSVGSTDVTAFVDSLAKNSKLTELRLSHNSIANSSSMSANMAAWIKSESCVLQTLDLKSCDLKPGDLEVLASALLINKSLKTVDVSGNKVSSHQALLDFLLASLCHEQITEVKMDDMQVVTPGEWKPGASSKPENCSKVHSLFLNKCQLTDSHVTALSEYCPSGVLGDLKELVLTSNPDLSMKALKAFHALTTDSDQSCPLEMLSWGQNQADGLVDLLSSGIFPKLHYINIRRAKISANKVSALRTIIQDGHLNTLVLDGIKLSGSSAMQDLLGGTAFVTSGSLSMSLEALSLGSCQLTDDDLQPVCQAIGQGLSLYMLKVSANRLTDVFVHSLVTGLKAQRGHPLALIDLSNNKVQADGAKALADLLKTKKNKSNLRSLNVSSNSIDAPGVEALVSVLGVTSLSTLQASNQQVSYEEHHMESIFKTLTCSLGLRVEKDKEGAIKPGRCIFPKLPSTFQCKLLNLGGYAGELGRMLDCAAICTDFQATKKPYLTLHQVFELASAIRGQESTPCLMSADEWNDTISAQKDAPAWLQLPDHRERAIYMTGLPASVSVQKMEGFLEMEADCGVDDIYLCKDVLTQRNNGFAWALLSDRKSVDKAIQLYEAGQAIVLGTSFIISDVAVSVQDDSCSQAEAAVRRDIEERLRRRLEEDKEHRRLIEQSYYASQERHAYRLAHPAYADGRIW